MSTTIDTVSIKEFHDLGYLQEVNRRFFHPLGLALTVVVSESGEVLLGDIQDCRDEPDGMIFAAGQLDPWKALMVDVERAKREMVRLDSLGYMTQPAPLIEPMTDEDVAKIEDELEIEPIAPERDALLRENFEQMRQWRLAKQRLDAEPDRAKAYLRELMYDIKAAHVDMGGKHWYTLDRRAWPLVTEIKAWLAGHGQDQAERVQLWIVGEVTSLEGPRDNPSAVTWDFHGVFDDESKAVDRCLGPMFFVGPAVLNRVLPVEAVEWEGAYYPMAKASEEVNDEPA